MRKFFILLIIITSVYLSKQNVYADLCHQQAGFFPSNIISNADVDNDWTINGGTNVHPLSDSGSDSGFYFYPGNSIHSSFRVYACNGYSGMKAIHHNPQGTYMKNVDLPDDGIYKTITPYTSWNLGKFYSTDYGITWIPYSNPTEVPEDVIITSFKLVNVSPFKYYNYKIRTNYDFSGELLQDKIEIRKPDPNNELEGYLTSYFRPVKDQFCFKNWAKVTVEPISTEPTPTPVKEIFAKPDTAKVPNNQTNYIPILPNDSFDKNIPTPETVNVLVTGSAPIPEMKLTPDGKISVPPTTTEGKITVTYKICERTSPDNCSQEVPVTIELYSPEKPVNPTTPSNPAPTPVTPTPVTPKPTTSTPSGGGSSSTPPAMVAIPNPKPTPAPVVDTPLFSAPIIGGQCISAVKNLDDPKLMAYYDDLNVINRENLHRTITRVEFIKLVLNAWKVNLSSETNLEDLASFTDIDVNSWYAPYIAYMLHTHTMNGQELLDENNVPVVDENGNVQKIFRPNDSISRAEASKILSELVRKYGESLPNIDAIISFEDVLREDALSPYIQYAFDNCLLHGRNTIDGHPIDGAPRIFEPFDSITLAETSKVLYNITHSGVDSEKSFAEKITSGMENILKKNSTTIEKENNVKKPDVNLQNFVKIEAQNTPNKQNEGNQGRIPTPLITPSLQPQITIQKNI